MFKILSATLLVMAFGDAVLAAEYDISPRKTHRREAIVDTNRHLYPRGCPDRYSCSGLYDAYGPYGGRFYLGAYTRLDAYTRLY